MKLGTKALAVGIALSTVIALTACGGPGADAGSPPQSKQSADTSAIGQLNAMSHDKQRAEAVKQAKAEGSLSFYNGESASAGEAIAAAFTKEFGIPVSLFRASSETVAQRITQEASANHLGADVTFLAFALMDDVAKQNIDADYNGKALDGLDKGAIHKGWITAAGYLYVPIWNTDVIKSGDEPKSWEDLADSRFKGKLTLEATDSPWFGAVSTYWKDQGKSQAEIDALWKGIAANASVGAGHSAMMQLLGAGQTGVDGMNYSFIADGAIDKGSPVAYRSSDGIVHTPAFVNQVGVAMFKSAPHPAAAWLFNDWLLQEGQKVLSDQHYVSAAVAAGTAKATGETILPFPEEVITDSKQWAARYDALLRGVPVVDQPKK